MGCDVHNGRSMSSIDVTALREALQTVKYPGFSRDIVSFGLVKDIQTDGQDVQVQMTLTTADPKVARTIHDEAEAALKRLPGVRAVEVKIDVQAPAQAAGN